MAYTDPQNPADGVANTLIGGVAKTAGASAANSWFNGTTWDRARNAAGSSLGKELAVTNGTLPGTSLNAATAPVVGTVANYITARTSVGMAVTITGAPTAVTVVLEGSLDGTNWFPVGTFSNTTSGLLFVPGICINQARANLTVLTGGTAPTITAKIAANG